MRIHTSLTAHQVRQALADQQSLGKIAPGVRVELHQHGSRSNDRAFEFTLISPSIREGEKRRSQSAYGHPIGDNEFGGTWAEYGWFIEALFAADYSLAIPRIYPDWSTFSEMTENVFDDGMTHTRIPAARLRSGDYIVGFGIQGSGLRYVREVTPGSRPSDSLTVSLRRQGGMGHYWTEDARMNPKRMVTVAR